MRLERLVVMLGGAQIRIKIVTRELCQKGRRVLGPSGGVVFVVLLREVVGATIIAAWRVHII